MKCQEIRELMPDLAAGLSAPSAETKQHLQTCAACAGKLAEIRQTMALLDEWQAPEPSPYFDVRLGARLREEAAQRQGSSWLHWIRKPALSLSLAVLMVMGIALFRGDGSLHRSPMTASNAPAEVAQPGTAVGDLQTLDKNHDIYSDFELLDDLQVQPNVNANP